MTQKGNPYIYMFKNVVKAGVLHFVTVKYSLHYCSEILHSK